MDTKFFFETTFYAPLSEGSLTHQKRVRILKSLRIRRISWISTKILQFEINKIF